MVSVFSCDVAIRLNSCSSFSAVVALSRYPKVLTGILVDPFGLKPASRIGVVRRNEMKSFRIDSVGMSQRAYMASLKKIERLNLFGVRLTSIERPKASHHRGATNGRTSDSWLTREF